jgi:hypothetical protein
MTGVMGDIIGAEKAATFAKELKAVHEVEQLYGELTAGLLRATAACLKV